MNTNELNEIIAACRRHNLTICFDGYGMTVSVRNSGHRAVRFTADMMEDGRPVVDFGLLIAAAVQELEKEDET